MESQLCGRVVELDCSSVESARNVGGLYGELVDRDRDAELLELRLGPVFGGVGEDSPRADLTESIHVGMFQYAHWIVVFRIDRNPETPPRVDRDLLELLGADPHELDHDSAIEGDVVLDHHGPDQPCWDFLTMEHPPPDCEDTCSIEGSEVVPSLQGAWGGRTE